MSLRPPIVEAAIARPADRNESAVLGPRVFSGHALIVDDNRINRLVSADPRCPPGFCPRRFFAIDSFSYSIRLSERGSNAERTPSPMKTPSRMTMNKARDGYRTNHQANRNS